ncbi:MAG TPA: hypothetical protein VKX46_10040 [Ktedonobacteraceae bacterium]|nr:hypothetical protein [Ktedonobacteraceae bacterium]
MGSMITFYAANPAAFVDLCKRASSVETDDEEAEASFEQLESLPMADFTLNFRLPEHMDALCQALNAAGIAAPASYQELLGEPLWHEKGGRSISECHRERGEQYTLP